MKGGDEELDQRRSLAVLLLISKLDLSVITAVGYFLRYLEQLLC